MERDGAHIGDFMEWVYQNGLAPDDSETDDLAECQQLINSEITWLQFLIENCDGKFWDVDLNQQGQQFAQYAYDDYLDNYTMIVGHEPYLKNYNQQDLEKIKKYLDKTFEQFRVKSNNDWL